MLLKSILFLGGHEEIVRLLLEADDIDVNLSDNVGTTPLHRSAQNGNVEIMKRLLIAGAKPSAISRSGKT